MPTQTAPLLLESCSTARRVCFRDLADGLELEAMAETARLQEEMRVYREEHPRAAAIGVGEAGQREFAAWHRAFREERRARLVELIRRIRA
jgi:predicted RNA-binding protein